ncbi:sigma-70 family RNA polymerase sigma factor [bacterium]|nr:sigma-70 family RNA polymerase sigma factor [bacterium]
MKIPKKMTQEEVIKQIHIVINRIAPRYTFSGYDVDDIKQEAFIICMDALDRYDNKRPLENFLSVHLSNRLKNFIRDNFYTKDEEDKKRVLKPKSLSSEDYIPSNYSNDSDTSIDAKNIQSILDKHLPPSYRSDYLKLINDVYVPKKRREELISIIKEIVENHNEER